MEIKNKRKISKMRYAGQQLASILQEMGEYVKVGISTLELDSIIENKIKKCGLIPACIGYGGFKHASCISLNDELIHGVPKQGIFLKNGDFVKIDVTASYKSYCADVARFFFVGECNDRIRKIAEVGQNALNVAIKVAVHGNKLSDISRCIQKVIEDAGFSVVREFAGHGIGKDLHEYPEIPNFVTKDEDPIVLQDGMVLAIEPMIAEFKRNIYVADDSWTVRTKDGGYASHVEDTVVVKRDYAEILTRIQN